MKIQIEGHKENLFFMNQTNDKLMELLSQTNDERIKEILTNLSEVKEVNRLGNHFKEIDQ